MAIIGLLGTVASTAMSMMGAQQQAKAQEEAALRQAEQHRAQSELQARQAVIGQTTAGYEQRRKSEQIDQVQARQRNIYGTTGLTIDGSPMDVMADTASEGALDVAAIQWNSELKASNNNFEAQISQFNSDTSVKAAKTARQTGNINAASALVGGLSSATNSVSRLGLRF